MEGRTMRKLVIVIVLMLACCVPLLAQTLSPQVCGFVKVDAPVVALTHVRVIDGTGRYGIPAREKAGGVPGGAGESGSSLQAGRKRRSAARHDPRPVQRHVAVTSTLPVFEMGSFAGRPTMQKRVLDALSPDARSAVLRRVRSSDSSMLRQEYGSEGSPWPAAFKKEMEFEHAFVQEAGLLLAGLDPTGMGGVIARFGDQREVELLVEAGFTPVEAIHIATTNGAQYLGELDRIGTIAPGKAADLVVIKDDPSKNIEDIENVETVFKDGIGYDSAKLIESVRGVVGSR
jgi:hypothetical protein